MERVRVENKVKRVRFAPTPPLDGGEFIHIGHLSTIVFAWDIAKSEQCRFEVRIDGKCNKKSLLDVVNALLWIGCYPDRIYRLPSVTDSQIFAFSGNTNLPDGFSNSELSGSFDDLIEHPETIIVRGMEFVREGIKERWDKLDRFWGCERDERNAPLVRWQGMKMSKSATRNKAIHWSALTDFDPERVRAYFLYKATKHPVQWDWSWTDFVENYSHIVRN